MEEIRKIIDKKFLHTDQYVMQECKGEKVLSRVDVVSIISQKKCRKNQKKKPKCYDYVIYRFDREGNGKLLTFLSCEPGLQSICDYVVFCKDKENVLYVLLVEMKGVNGAIRQLNSTELLVRYILSRRESIKECDNSVKFGIDDERVSFIKIKIRNQRNKLTQPTSMRDFDKKEKMFVVEGGGDFDIGRFIYETKRKNEKF